MNGQGKIDAVNRQGKTEAVNGQGKTEAVNRQGKTEAVNGQARTDAATEKIKILYVAGWGRSGSTILNSVLGQAAGCFAGGELRYVWSRNLGGDTDDERHACGCGQEFRRCETWSRVLHQLGAELAPEAVESALQRVATDRRIPRWILLGDRRRIRDQLGENADRLVALYRALQQSTGSPLIVDSSKVPAYAYVLDALDELDVHVLHLVRDSRAVAHSWLRKKMQQDLGRTMIRRGAFESGWRWAIRNLEVDLLASRLRRPVRRLRYEAMIDNPRALLTGLLRAIEPQLGPIPFTSDHVVEMQPIHTSSGNPNRFATGPVKLQRDDAWRQRMRRRDRWIVTALTWPLLVRYGYRG